jgi:hypothetical protein
VNMLQAMTLISTVAAITRIEIVHRDDGVGERWAREFVWCFLFIVEWRFAMWIEATGHMPWWLS